MKLLLALCVSAWLFLPACGDIQPADTRKPVANNQTSVGQMGLDQPSTDSQTDGDEMTKVQVNIAGESYDVSLFDNETAAAFLALLPNEFELRDLNNNEKYTYLAKALPAKPQAVARIESGDIMLYQDDCLVVFYQSFNTSYHYTKIGHINTDLDLAAVWGNKSIKLEFFPGE
jgi:hypothetical protein